MVTEDQESVEVVMVVMTKEKHKRIKVIPFEMEEALANNDRDRLSALVREFKQICRSRS